MSIFHKPIEHPHSDGKHFCFLQSGSGNNHQNVRMAMNTNQPNTYQIIIQGYLSEYWLD